MTVFVKQFYSQIHENSTDGSLPMLCNKQTDGRLCSARNTDLISKVSNNQAPAKLIAATGCVLRCSLSQLITLKHADCSTGSAVCCKTVNFVSCYRTYRKMICANRMLQKKASLWTHRSPSACQHAAFHCDS